MLDTSLQCAATACVPRCSEWRYTGQAFLPSFTQTSYFNVFVQYKIHTLNLSKGMDYPSTVSGAKREARRQAWIHPHPIGLHASIYSG